MIESRDFEDLFELLNANEVEYLVVGGYAVAVHSRPRFTDDLDLFVSRSEVNTDRLMTALSAFGYGPPELTAERFRVRNRVIQLGVPPYRIDVLTSIKGVQFDDAWPRRKRGRYGRQEVFFIGRDDLIASKAAAARPKDLEDLRVLRASGDGSGQDAG
ncbi:MAG: hypothetical protein ACI80V_003724 [Rhodothermales bacterium]|jgi:hypothetical protein